MEYTLTKTTEREIWQPAPDRELDSTLRRLVDVVGVDRVRFELWRIEQEIVRNSSSPHELKTPTEGDS